MVHTINDDGPWKYLSLLNECIKMLLTILIGVAMAYFRLFDAKTFVPQASTFVFRVALPLHVFRGIGIVVDFYDDKFQWEYINSFLLLRAVALVLCFAWVLVTSTTNGTKGSIGQVAVLWLATTWISTVIIGVPISKALFGSESLGLFYGLLAGISSFIFQLPLQLLFLECHALEHETLQIRNGTRNENNQVPSHAAEGNQVEEMEVCDPLSKNISPPVAESPSEPLKCSTNADETDMVESDAIPLNQWPKLVLRNDILRKIAYKVCTNPVIWGIVWGFIFSLSKIGPKYLKPASKDFVPGLGWIFTTTEWMGNCVSPISLFAMGVWMQNQGYRLFQVRWQYAILSMIAKLIVIPSVMLVIAKVIGLSDHAGRAAILIASLPISMASFSLANNYKVGEALLAENVALGTLLMLPTVIAWNVFLDEVGLFPL